MLRVWGRSKVARLESGEGAEDFGTVIERLPRTIRVERLVSVKMVSVMQNPSVQ